MGKPTTRFHVLRAGGYIGYEPPKKGADMLHLRDCTNCTLADQCHVNKLLPPGVEPEPPKANLQALQAEADKRGLLLPAVFNRAQKPAKDEDADDDDLLLPVGVGR